MGRVTLDAGQFRKVTDNVQKRLANGIAAVAVAQIELVNDAFRNTGQPGEPWAPLWADSFVPKVAQSKNEAVARAAERLSKAKERLKKARNISKAAESVARAQVALTKAQDKATPGKPFRAGGKRLSGTTSGAKSFHIVKQGLESGIGVSVIASSAFFHKWHQTGFKTKGPNFIPLTKKAQRLHVKGANPKEEGLEDGVDYIIAWKGVTVPASVMIDYSNTVNKTVITDAARAGFFGAL